MPDPILNLRKKDSPKIEPTKPRHDLPAKKSETDQTTEIRPIAKKSSSISWQSKVYRDFRSLQRFVFGVIVIGGLVGFFYDMLLGIFIALAGGVYLLYARAYPSNYKIELGQAGVTLNGAFYPYRDLKSFWLDYTPGNHKELSLELRQWHLPYLRIPLDSINPVQIRSKLIEMLPEKEHEQSILTAILRRFGL